MEDLESICTCSEEYFNTHYLGDDNVKNIIDLKRKSIGKNFTDVIGSYGIQYFTINDTQTLFRMNRFLVKLYFVDEDECFEFLEESFGYLESLTSYQEEYYKDRF